MVLFTVSESNDLIGRHTQAPCRRRLVTTAGQLSSLNSDKSKCSLNLVRQQIKIQMNLYPKNPEIQEALEEGRPVGSKVYLDYRIYYFIFWKGVFKYARYRDTYW